MVMNGIEKITDRIATEAGEKVANILAEAQAKAEKLAADYEAQAAAEKAALVEKGRTAAADREQRLVSMAQMEARNEILTVKQNLLDKAFEVALDQLCSLPEEQYVTVLEKLLQQAVTSGKEEVILSPGDREQVGQTVVDKVNAASGWTLTLSDETRSIRGGVILRDGSVEVNCTFETLLRICRTDIAGEVANALCG